MRHQVRGVMTPRSEVSSRGALLPDPVVEAPTALNEPVEIFRKDRHEV